MKLASWFESAILRGRPLEQRLLAQFFATTTGVFVEVGANDPVEGSMTWQLEQAGWDGLLVEPLSEHANTLRRNRKAKVAAVACGAPEHEGRAMELRIAGRGGVQSTLACAFVKADIAQSDLRVVPVTTLDSLLVQHSLKRVDLLSIDVEGFELEVLRGFSLGRHRPQLIILEDRVRGLRLHRHMRANRYRVIRRVGQNAWYVPDEAIHRVSPYGRFQLLRKYYLGLPFRILRRWRPWPEQRPNLRLFGWFA